MVRVNNTLFVHLIPILQLAIAPVILISGVGLLLLTLTNRFGRVLDRARALNRDAELSAHVREQIEILRRRASILRTSVMLVGTRCYHEGPRGNVICALASLAFSRLWPRA